MNRSGTTTPIPALDGSTGSLYAIFKRTIATPMMPIPRNATLFWHGAATGCCDDDDDEAAAAAATEEEEVAALVLQGHLRSMMPRGSRPSFRELCARNKGLISIEREEYNVPEA